MSYDDVLKDVREFYDIKIEPASDDKLICTSKNEGLIWWEKPKDPGFDAWRNVPTNYGFIRALCDKSGNVLAYSRAIRIIPDPFPSQFHIGTWYAFQEYNPEMMPKSKISALGYPGDSLGATWEYDLENRLYRLNIPTSFGEIKHWFVVSDDKITSDYGEMDLRTYPYNVRHTKPNKDVVNRVKEALIIKNVLPQRDNVANRRRLFPRLVTRIGNRAR